MDQIKLVNIENGTTAIADVIKKSRMNMRVAVVGTNLTINLSKKTPDEKNYNGRGFGMEFVSTGELI